MNYTEFSDFNELINSYKELFSDVRSEKNLVEGKKREVKSASSLIDRKTSQANQLENRVDSIENSLNTTSSQFYNNFDNQKQQRIRTFFDLKKQREHLTWQRSKLSFQSNQDPTITTPITEAQEARLNILINSINQSISQLESTIANTFDGSEYQLVEDFNRPVLGEDSEQKIWENYAYHIESMWIDHWFGLKYTIEDFMDKAIESHSEISIKKQGLVSQMRALEDYRSNLTSALESNASESTIESIESQIQSAKQAVRFLANDIGFTQAKIDALDTQTETTLQLWSEKAETYLNDASNSFNQNKKILVARGVKDPRSEFQLRVVEMISPIVDVIKASIGSINTPGAQSFVSFIDALFQKEEQKNLDARDYMQFMNDFSAREMYIKNPNELIQTTTFPDGTSKKVFRSEIPASLIGDVFDFYNALSPHIQQVTDFKANVEKNISLFNQGWSNFASYNYMQEINQLRSRYVEFTSYRNFVEREHSRLNYGHYGITQEEKNSWHSAWMQKDQAETDIWVMQKELSVVSRRRNNYQNIFQEAFDQHYSLKSSMDNTESAYVGTNDQYDYLSSELASAYDYLQTLTVGEAEYQAALADYEAKAAAYDLVFTEGMYKKDGPGGSEEAYNFLQTTLAGEADYQAAYPFENKEASGLINTDEMGNPLFQTSCNGIVKSSAIQADGKLVIGGDFYYLNGGTIGKRGINRLLADGSPDTSFTGIGIEDGGLVNAVAIQSDGKILIGGYFHSYNGITAYSIARLNTDGSLDNTFISPTEQPGFINSIAIQSDGKIVVGGEFQTYNGDVAIRIIRLNTDGSVDSTFVNNSSFNWHVRSIIILSDDKILVGGSFSKNIVRLNSDGSVDSTFVTGTGFNGDIFSITIQPDGKILAVGDVSNYNGTSISGGIARLNTDGSLDTSFVTSTGFNNLVTTIALQSNGKILVGGMFSSYSGTSANRIARLNTDGSIDTTFVTGTGFNADVLTITINLSGTIYIGGSFGSYNNISQSGLAKMSGIVYTQIDIDSLNTLHYVYLGAQADYDTKLAIKDAYFADVVTPAESLKNDSYVFLQDLTDENAAYQAALNDWTNKESSFNDYKDNVRTPAYDAFQVAQAAFNEFLGKEFRFYSATVTGYRIAELVHDHEVLVPQQISDAYATFNTKQQEFDELQSSLTWVEASENDKLDWLESERGQFANYLAYVCNAINAEVATLIHAAGDPNIMGWVQYLKAEVGAVPGEWFTSNYESLLNDKMSGVIDFLDSNNSLFDATFTKEYNNQKYVLKLNSSSIWEDLGFSGIKNLIRVSNEGVMSQQRLVALGDELFHFLGNKVRGFNGIGTRPSIIGWLDNGGSISEGMI